jgi:hypothetical protein
MGRSTLTQLVILQAIGLGLIAVAGSSKAAEHGGDRSPASVASLEERMASRKSIRGTLQCPNTAALPGTTCTLQILNRDTGEAIRIVGSETARKLLEAGQTQVVATGSIMDGDMRVIDIRAE